MYQNKQNEKNMIQRLCSNDNRKGHELVWFDDKLKTLNLEDEEYF